MKPDGSTIPALVAELRAALAVLRADGDGPDDPLVNEIAEALRANTTKAMQHAADLWREFRGCCAWMNCDKEAGNG